MEDSSHEIFIYFLVVLNPLTRPDQKLLHQISRTSLCGLNRVAVDMDPLGSDVCFLIVAPLKCSCCGKDIVIIMDFYNKDKKNRK